MDVLTLSRWQFAITTTYHFLFVPITLGLSLFLALLQTYSLKAKDEETRRECRGLVQFFGVVFLINFGLGVVTGIVQEFHFGMNWSEYARFMGDIFGAPLALEALSAFFLESTFLGLWVFGRKKLSPKLHCLCIWMVALASNLSAFWILVANSFMQHPVGYALRNGRVEMTDFFALITNPYAILQFGHTLFACMTTGGCVILAICAYKMLQNGPAAPAFRKCFGAAAVYTIVGLMAAMGSGHMQAQQIGRVQPMKLAAMEALWESADPAPFALFALIDEAKQENPVEIKVPYALSFMLYNRPEGEVKGLRELQDVYMKQYGPDDYQPSVPLVFWSFRIMLATGGMILAIAAGAAFMRWRKLEWKWLLRLSILGLPLPFLSNSFGWIIAEVGRQPWLVYGLQKTAEGFSPMVSARDVLITVVGYTLIYFVLAIAGLYAALRYIRRTPADAQEWRNI